MKKLVILLIAILFCINSFAENCKGETVNNLQEGHWKCFYDDGTIQQEGVYKSGKKDGEWKFYHANGKVALSGKYSGDTEKGKWIVFDEEGNKIDEIDYGD